MIFHNEINCLIFDLNFCGSGGRWFEPTQLYDSRIDAKFGTPCRPTAPPPDPTEAFFRVIHAGFIGTALAFHHGRI